MKKYLMTGIAALAMGGIFTSCGPDMSVYNKSQSEQILQKYEQSFVQAFGEPASTQTWGFGSSTVAGARGTTRSNPGVDYPATSTGINANANQWADPDNEFGGWIVPDPLTDEQKTVVRAYFQANPNLPYQDPEWRHFFVQQVYKGATSPGNNSTEVVTAADNTKYTSDNMNLLTVGYNEQHVNNFNKGDCSVNGDVLDNGSNVNENKHHSDQIMLMVNIDDTQCFGYHNTGISMQRNDKAALVGWETIRTWANSKGLNGDCLNDGWNRSFLGFDFELFTLEEACINEYAPISDISGNTPEYVWDGTKIMKRGAKPADDSQSNGGTDLTSFFANCYSGSISNENGTLIFHANAWGGLQAYNFGENTNWSSYDKFIIEFAEATPDDAQLSVNNGPSATIVAGTTKFELDIKGNNYNNVSGGAMQAQTKGGDFKINKIYLVGSAPQIDYYESDYIIVNGQHIPFLSANMNMYGGTQKNLSDGDMKINKDGKECLNLPAFKALVDEGYLPVKDKNLRTWVKWAGGDGYFSDWIVTLTEAKRIPQGGGSGSANTETIRVMGEDLTINTNSDFDFNDVVFDVTWGKGNKEATIVLKAAGGELPIYIVRDDDELEIHALFANANPGSGITQKTMINTAAGHHNDYKCPQITLKYSNNDNVNWDAENIHDFANSIKIIVYKKGSEFILNAPKGDVPSKIAVGTNFEWCDERLDIDKRTDGRFSEYVKGAHSWDTWY